MMNILNKLFGSSSKRQLKSYSKIVDKINSIEKDLSTITDLELKDKTVIF